MATATKSKPKAPKAEPQNGALELWTDEEKQEMAVKDRAETRALLAPWREKLLQLLQPLVDAGQIEALQLFLYQEEHLDKRYEERNHFEFRVRMPNRSLQNPDPKVSIILAREEI